MPAAQGAQPADDHTCQLIHGKPLSFRQMVRLICDQGKLLDRVAAVHQKERRALAQAEKFEKATMTEPILSKQQSRYDRLRGQQAAERTAERTAQIARSQSITFAHAKASLRAEPYIHDLPLSVFKRDQDMRPTASEPSRIEEIKRHMDEWRRRHPDTDFGHEF